MEQKLKGKRIAILVADGFEQVELTGPKEALDEAGAVTYIVSPNSAQVKGWNHTQWGDYFPVHATVDRANPDDYDALLLPGGVLNPDLLRVNQAALKFVRSFFNEGKPVASICHGPWTLIDAGVVKGRTMTSWESIRTDLKNAGAQWVNQEVVADHGLVTSRTPNDLPAFNRKIIEEFAEGRHRRQQAVTS